MQSARRGLLTSLLFISFMSCGLAEDGRFGGGTVDAASPLRSTLTGKERLGPKWTDEQRIDNCKVPIEKRGTKPRPSACAKGPPS